MPRLRKPLSALARLVFLKHVLETSEKEAPRNQVYVSETTLEHIRQFLPGFENGLGDVSHYASLSQKEIREKNVAMDELQVYVRDLWEGLKRRVYREKLPLEVFALYQLPKNGNKPEPGTNRQWLEVADLVVQGDVRAVQLGYEPMTNPSAQQVAEKLEQARKEMQDVSDADLQLDRAQEAVSDLMPEAKRLIDRVIAELEFNLYDKDEAGKRRIMRNYGVQFEAAKNEVLEEDIEVKAN